MLGPIHQLSLRLCLCLSVTAQPGWAESVVSGEAFEQMSEGKVMRFTQNGRYYGAEQFYSDRRSTWQYEDGSCVDGIWYEEAGAICFDYEDNFPAQCWIFAERDDEYFARLRGSSPDAPGQLQLFSIDEDPLECAGPDLGV